MSEIPWTMCSLLCPEAQNVEGRAVTKLGRIRKENEDQIIRDLEYQAQKYGFYPTGMGNHR